MTYLVLALIVACYENEMYKLKKRVKRAERLLGIKEEEK